MNDTRTGVEESSITCATQNILYFFPPNLVPFSRYNVDLPCVCRWRRSGRPARLRSPSILRSYDSFPLPEIPGSRFSIRRIFSVCISIPKENTRRYSYYDAVILARDRIIRLTKSGSLASKPTISRRCHASSTHISETMGTLKSMAYENFSRLYNFATKCVVSAFMSLRTRPPMKVINDFNDT